MAPESRWNCPACGTQALLTTNHLHCPACGHEQDASAHYPASPVERAASSGAHPFVGADLACLVCHTLNAASSNYCGGCGCSLAGAREMPNATGSRARMLRAESSSASESQSIPPSQSRSSMSAAELSRSGMRPSDSLRAEIDAERKRQAELSRQRMTQVSANLSEAETKRARRRLVGGLAVVVLAALVYQVRHRARPGEAEVLAHEWERILALAQCREEVDTAPCNRLPPRAQLIGERGGPNTCAYRLRAWRVVREAKLDGEGVDSTREWPTYRLRWTGTGDCENCEREGERTERFILRLRYQGRIEHCDIDRGTWERTAIGDTFDIGESRDAPFDCAWIGTPDESRAVARAAGVR